MQNVTPAVYITCCLLILSLREWYFSFINKHVKYFFFTFNYYFSRILSTFLCSSSRKLRTREQFHAAKTFVENEELLRNWRFYNGIPTRTYNNDDTSGNVKCINDQDTRLSKSYSNFQWKVVSVYVWNDFTIKSNCCWNCWPRTLNINYDNLQFSTDIKDKLWIGYYPLIHNFSKLKMTVIILLISFWP